MFSVVAAPIYIPSNSVEGFKTVFFLMAETLAHRSPCPAPTRGGGISVNRVLLEAGARGPPISDVRMCWEEPGESHQNPCSRGQSLREAAQPIFRPFS